MTLLDAAKSLRGSLRDGISANQVGSSRAVPSLTYGEAVADSEDGFVTIRLDNAPTDGSADFTVACESPIKEGNRVTYTSIGGYGKAVSIENLAVLTESAETAASEAQAVAEAVNEHFWDDANGAHVTEVEQESWTDPTSPDYHSGRDITLNANGIILREDYTPLASFTPSAVAFYDGQGDQPENVTASFGTNGASIGRAGGSHLMLDYHSMQFADKDGNVYLDISDLRDSSGLATLVQTFTGDGTTSTFMVSETISDVVSVLVAGDDVTSTTTHSGVFVVLQSAPSSGAAVVITYKTGNRCASYTLGTRDPYDDVAPNSYVFGNGGAATSNFALAEGISTNAYGYASHAEGSGATASGLSSHAEGESTTSSAMGSHAEGRYCEASGDAAHAEGVHTVASGHWSHAGGYYTQAASRDQTVVGAYNVPDTAAGEFDHGDYAFIVGNGTGENQRANAFTVGWNGDVTAGGEVIDGNGNKLSDPCDLSTATGTLPIASGGTGATTAQGARKNLHIGAATATKTSATSTATTNTKITLNSITSSDSSLFSISSGGIKCAVAGTVLVSASMYETSIASGNGGFALRILNGSTLIGSELVAPFTTNSLMASVTAAPRAVTIAAGDVIYLYHRSTKSGSIPANGAYLTVEYIA